ncbi:MAG: adenosine deaminase [Chloroflexi bacterium]|nr:adenosine deaminase [Chloroflexota bacterium]
MTETSSDLREKMVRLPKVDLHRHFEGSIRFETFLELVLPQDLPLPTRDPALLRRLVQVLPDEPPNFTNFLAKFAWLHTMYATPDVYGRIMHEVVEDAARDGVVHLELRLSLRHLTRHKGFAMPDVLGWLHSARLDAEKRFDISVALIPMLNREAPRELCEQIMRAVIDQPDGVIAAVDLAGDELNFPVPPVADLFDAARRRGLGITIHAGEAREAAIIDRCLTTYRPTRIGHGVHATDDLRTMRRLTDEGITLEVCPLSNIQTGAVADLRTHPLKPLRDAGLAVTVNTDDPNIQGTCLSMDYAAAITSIGLTLDDLRQMNSAAAEAAFLPRDQKRKLLARVKAGW